MASCFCYKGSVTKFESPLVEFTGRKEELLLYLSASPASPLFTPIVVTKLYRVQGLLFVFTDVTNNGLFNFWLTSQPYCRAVTFGIGGNNQLVEG